MNTDVDMLGRPSVDVGLTMMHDDGDDSDDGVDGDDGDDGDYGDDGDDGDMLGDNLGGLMASISRSEFCRRQPRY